jgi:inorganic pyrophosphatase
MIRLDAFDAESGYLNAVIETPKGSRNKFKYDVRSGLFQVRWDAPSGQCISF